MDADEVGATITAHLKLRNACGVEAKGGGRMAFDTINTLTQQSTTPHRTKELIKKLAHTWDRQRQDEAGLAAVRGTKILISGAGPVGLRAAAEAAMMGMEVTVLEKRETFSRVNILTLWQPTADDLVSFGARSFYPKFSNMANFLHLGTREIQLVLLKNCLLFGANVLYGTELLGLQAPPAAADAVEAGCLGATSLWCAWIKAKTAEELGFEVEEEYVKDELPMSLPIAGGSSEEHEADGAAGGVVVASPRGAKGGVAAAAAAFSKASAEAAAPAPAMERPRRKTKGDGKVLSAMAAFSAPEAEVCE